jgi:hypothetical protein
MTPTNQSTNGHDPVFQPLLDFWSKATEQGTESARAWWEGTRAAFDPAALRRQWLDAMAQSLDAYMRTPAFLESMRRSHQAVNEFKSHTEDLAQEIARETGIPRMPDISGLFERIQIGQESIQAHLSAIERRLEVLESQLTPGPR